MPYSKKQEKFFQAVAHGMEPRDSNLTPGKAKKLLSHSKRTKTMAAGEQMKALRGSR